MATYYDENFGCWDMSEEGSKEFYHKVQSSNIEKECGECGKIVYLQPQYSICNTCADMIEKGYYA